MAICRIQETLLVRTTQPPGLEDRTVADNQMATVKMATAPPTVRADLGFVLAAYALMVGAWIVGWALWEGLDPKGFIPVATISVFAPLYIFAQGIERVIEPFSTFLGSASEENERVKKEKAKQMLEEAIAKKAPDEAAKWQEIVNKIRRNTAVITWGLASALGMLASGAMGIFLLKAIGLQVHAWVDIAVTGLAIGSGTKPLHELISNLQKAKEQREDPPETSSSRT